MDEEPTVVTHASFMGIVPSEDCFSQFPLAEPGRRGGCDRVGIETVHLKKKRSKLKTLKKNED